MNHDHQLETSSKSLYLLTLFLNTCFVNPLFDISSDLVLLSFSSNLPFVISLLRVDGDLSGDLCFLMGLLICNRKVPLWFFDGPA